MTPRIRDENIASIPFKNTITMKIKTLFFTSILAAAAMSAVPAWAEITYTWSSNRSSGNWDNTTPNWVIAGSTNSAFVNGNDAKFSTDAVVTVAANISVAKADITKTLTLKRSSGTSYKVTATGSFNVGESATLKYGASDMISGSLSVKGTLDLGSYSADSASISVEKNGTLKLSVNTDSTVKAKAVSFASGAKLVLDLSNASIKSGTTLSILSSSESAIQYNGSALAASDVEALAASSVFGNYSDWKREWSVEKTTTGSTLKLKLTDPSAVPEPSMFGLLAGVGALAFVAARRRRRAK